MEKSYCDYCIVINYHRFSDLIGFYDNDKCDKLFLIDFNSTTCYCIPSRFQFIMIIIIFFFFSFFFQK